MFASQRHFVLLFSAILCFFGAAVLGSGDNVGPLPAESMESFSDHKSRAYVFADPEWYNWGASVILTEDGEYHMFYARWPRKYGFLSWLTHSEIAHAVADKLEGPYRYVETSIKARGSGYWDQITAHNPKIKFFEGKYYLYYISTTDGGLGLSDVDLVDTARGGYRHKYWKPLRENQRTGAAWAEKLSGPWHRLNKPIVEPAKTITTLTVNPAVTRGPDGTYFMIVKGDKPGTTKFIRNQALATAKNPLGPFEIYDKPVIDTLDTEDASMWYDKRCERFFAVFHAHNFIGQITSEDGYKWEKAEDYIFTEKQIKFSNGSIWKPDRMERPFVFTDESGKPLMLFVSAKKGDFACNVHLPLIEKGSPSKIDVTEAVKAGNIDIEAE